MDWISKNKAILILVSVVSTLTAIILIFLSRNNIISFGQQSWQLGILALPWIILTASFFPLVYLSWFKNKAVGFFSSLQKVFFMILVGLFSLFWIIFYSSFVFKTG